MCENLETRLIAFVRSFSDSLPVDIVEELVDTCSHREWGVTFENLCEHLYDADVVLTSDAFNAIQRFAAEMGIPDSRWSFLKTKF